MLSGYPAIGIRINFRLETPTPAKRTLPNEIRVIISPSNVDLGQRRFWRKSSSDGLPGRMICVVYPVSILCRALLVYG
jgi:hypothetical protein